MLDILLVNLKKYWCNLNPHFKAEKMKNYKTFETDRLLIRPTMDEDASFILELMNTPKWIAGIGDRNLSSVEDAKIYINQKMKPQLESHGYSNNTVIRKSDGVKLGTCGLYDREGLEGVDIGFAFLPAHEKQGYAFESAARILQAGFEDFNIKLVSAITTPENMDSQKLIKKLGLKYIKMVEIPGDDVELMLFQLSK